MAKKKNLLNVEGRIASEDVKKRPEKEKQVLDIVNSFVSSVESSRSAMQAKWRNWYKLYLGKEVDDQRDTTRREKLDPNIIFQLTEDLTRFYVSMMFSGPNFYKVKPVESTDVKISAIRQLVLDWQMDAMDFKRKLRDGTRNMVVMGTQFYKILWNQSEPKTQVYLGSDGKPVVKKRATIDMLDMASPRLEDVYVDPCLTIEQFPEAGIICHVMDKTADSLLNNKKYHGVKEAILETSAREEANKKKRGRKPVYTPSSPDANSASSAGQDYMGVSNRPITHLKEYKVMEAWLNFDLDDDGQAEPCLAYVFEKSKVIYLEQNPYWFNSHPFFISRFLPLEGMLYGRGVADINYDLAIAARDFLNHALDNIDIITNGDFITTTNSRIKREDVVRGPNKLYISHSTVNDLIPVPHQNIAAPALEGSKLCMAIAKDNVGVSDTMQGLPLGGRTSATEAQNVIENAVGRPVEGVKDLELTVTKPFICKAMRLDEQLMDKDYFLRITGKKGLDYAAQYPSSIVGDFDVAVVGVTQMENMVQAMNKHIGFLNIVSKIPPAMSGVDITKQIKKIYEVMGGDFDEIAAPSTYSDSPHDPEEENIVMMDNPEELLEPSKYEDQELHLRVHQSIPDAMNRYNVKLHIGKHDMLMEMMKGPTGGGIGPTSTSPQSTPLTRPPDTLTQGPEGAIQGGMPSGI